MGKWNTAGTNHCGGDGGPLGALDWVNPYLLLHIQWGHSDMRSRVCLIILEAPFALYQVLSLFKSREVFEEMQRLHRALECQ